MYRKVTKNVPAFLVEKCEHVHGLLISAFFLIQVALAATRQNPLCEKGLLLQWCVRVKCDFSKYPWRPQMLLYALMCSCIMGRW